MNRIDYKSADGKVSVVRTHMNCEVRTRWARGDFGREHEQVTLETPPLSIVADETERVHEHARQRMTVRSEA